MADMTLAEIDAEITELNAALKKWLTGKAVVQVGYEGSSVQYGGDLLSRPQMIRQRLAELKLMRSKLTGEDSGLGPIRPSHGGGA